VAENNTPRLMDAARECFLYDEFRQNVHLLVYRSIWFQQLRNDEENSMTAMLNFSTSELLNPATDELKLINLSQQGDADAFARLYAFYVERITRYVYFRVTDHQLAEDITSRIFLKMLEKLDTYRVGQSPVIAWLYRMAHNAVIDHYRTKRTFISLEDVHPAEVRHEDRIEEKLELQIKSQQLRAALQVLTEEQQRVLVLKFMDGLSTQEIARQLGKRQGAVRGLQMRALKKLARCPCLQREQVLGSVI
jgi:RNA polymerase sigma-70 factor (ECF subfamily)